MKKILYIICILLFQNLFGSDNNVPYITPYSNYTTMILMELLQGKRNACLEQNKTKSQALIVQITPAIRLVCNSTRKHLFTLHEVGSIPKIMNPLSSETASTLLQDIHDLTNEQKNHALVILTGEPIEHPSDLIFQRDVKPLSITNSDWQRIAHNCRVMR